MFQRSLTADSRTQRKKGNQHGNTHYWHVLYPTLRNIGILSLLAFSNASSPHGYQSTNVQMLAAVKCRAKTADIQIYLPGLSACCYSIYRT